MFIPFSQLLYLARLPVKLRWTSLDVVNGPLWHF
jgi:hypothetical protein